MVSVGTRRLVDNMETVFVSQRTGYESESPRLEAL